MHLVAVPAYKWNWISTEYPKTNQNEIRTSGCNSCLFSKTYNCHSERIVADYVAYVTESSDGVSIVDVNFMEAFLGNCTNMR